MMSFASQSLISLFEMFEMCTHEKSVLGNSRVRIKVQADTMFLMWLKVRSL